MGFCIGSPFRRPPMIAVPGHTDSARRPARPSAGRTLRLLVVEDDLLHARLLKANVERPGRVDVELAGSAGEALARLARPGIDAVITDLVMPGADGITLV